MYQEKVQVLPLYSVSLLPDWDRYIMATLVKGILLILIQLLEWCIDSNTHRIYFPADCMAAMA